MTTSNSSDRRELIVVTGASTGMGAATARELARRGFHVLAGVRRDVDADALRGDAIEPHILDITVESDVAAIAKRVAGNHARCQIRTLRPGSRRHGREPTNGCHGVRQRDRRLRVRVQK